MNHVNICNNEKRRKSDEFTSPFVIMYNADNLMKKDLFVIMNNADNLMKSSSAL